MEFKACLPIDNRFWQSVPTVDVRNSRNHLGCRKPSSQDKLSMNSCFAVFLPSIGYYKTINQRIYIYILQSWRNPRLLVMDFQFPRGILSEMFVEVFSGSWVCRKFWHAYDEIETYKFVFNPHSIGRWMETYMIDRGGLKVFFCLNCPWSSLEHKGSFRMV